MAHEPRRLVVEAESAVELMGGDALLARRHQVQAHQPLVEWDMAALHDGPGGDREVLPAFLFSAAIPARLLGLVGVVDRAAMRADRTFRPAGPLKEFPG